MAKVSGDASVGRTPRSAPDGLVRLSFAILLVGPLVFISSAAAESLDGVWKSQGYGSVIEIQGPVLKAFEVTEQTCVPGITAKRDNAVVPDREATFRTADGDVFFVRSGGSADHRLLHYDGSASDVRIDRLPRKPDACDHPARDTPLVTFDVFTRTWAEHYISFDLKHVNWNKIVAENRPKIAPQTTPARLFEVLEAMIKPFGDAHTFIEARTLKRYFHGLRPGTDRVISDLAGNGGSEEGGFAEFRKTGLPRLLTFTDKAYLHGPLKQYCNGQIQYGRIDDATGYLRILSFSGYAKNGGFAKGAEALETSLDEIFSDRGLRALVIDMRINFGGADPYGLSIASRLANNEYLAYTKEARSDPADHDKWTPGDVSTVRPSSQPGFHGSVVELTGPLTISAGETFTQALMGRTPHVTRIGENTQGVFSDVLVKQLPNGWVFGLPNEVYRTTAGAAFDGLGIPPDVNVPVFAAFDIAAGKDPAMAAALQILRNKP
jgi:hypothetical protein